jgi:predicted nucleotidyltransferase
MGGSRKWYYPRKNLNDLLEEQSVNEKIQENERAVNDFLQELASKLSQRDVEKIRVHLETLKKALEKEIDGTVELIFGGSVSKHTYAKGLSDIDMLVRLNNTLLSNAKPQEVLDVFAKAIKQRLPKTEVKKGDLAVTVKFSSGHEIQLLPSIKTATGYKIANPGTNEWSNVIKPGKFAEKLTSVNIANGGKIIPMVKIFKSINAQLPKNSQLSGYHIESLAIDAFKNKSSYPKTYKGLLQYFCEHASKAVLHPIKDSTGQSVHVDDYLGKSNSIERKRISNSLRILHKKMSQAASVEDWRDIIGD